MSNINFDKPERDIDRVFIHCSASSLPSHDDVMVVRGWHLKNGWSDIGYNYYITFDGVIHWGRDLERSPAAQRGHNAGTIAICLSGLNVDDFTQEQFDSLKGLCEQIDNQIPDVTFHGHCEVSDKECPVFDYKKVLNLTDFGVMQFKCSEEVHDFNASLIEVRREIDKLCYELEVLSDRVNYLTNHASDLGKLIKNL